ncbi:MAG TPA: polyphosphate kinase 2 family protein [Thermoplasmata archaeon]|nr:polyphosphate kinase 2 family protein [Thermoplasmata archaeon]
MSPYLVRPGTSAGLPRADPKDTSGFAGVKDDGRKELDRLRARLEALQELLCAEQKHAALVVLQGMDTAGKDGTIRRVFEGVNPQGVRVAAFKSPTPRELTHDFLWRVHAQVPARGEMVLFNRSHYEDVLVPRVHGLISRAECARRYREINEFERGLTEEGTTVLKFFLHISKGEQKRRLNERLDDPTKHWKFREADLRERRFWSAYMAAYEEALTRTSTAWAPWCVVPSDHKWYRDLIVSERIVDSLEALKMRYPPLLVELRGARVH